VSVNRAQHLTPNSELRKGLTLLIRSSLAILAFYITSSDIRFVKEIVTTTTHGSLVYNYSIIGAWTIINTIVIMLLAFSPSQLIGFLRPKTLASWRIISAFGVLPRILSMSLAVVLVILLHYVRALSVLVKCALVLFWIGKVF